MRIIILTQQKRYPLWQKRNAIGGFIVLIKNDNFTAYISKNILWRF